MNHQAPTNKRLPNGSLQYMSPVAEESTPLTISAAFAKLGLDIPAENIDVRQSSRLGPHAVVSIPAAAVSVMLNQTVANDPELGACEPLIATERRPQACWPPQFEMEQR